MCCEPSGYQPEEVNGECPDCGEEEFDEVNGEGKFQEVLDFWNEVPTYMHPEVNP